jgi:sarcosine oxidase subunit delta
MRIPCPHCGERSSAEFTTIGSAVGPRPAADAPDEAWHAYVHLRENPAGPNPEYWQHAMGCRAWLLVTRDTRNHRVLSVEALRREPA